MQWLGGAPLFRSEVSPLPCRLFEMLQGSFEVLVCARGVVRVAGRNPNPKLIRHAQLANPNTMTMARIGPRGLPDRL